MRLALILAGTTALAFASVAHAATVTLSNIVGTWSGAVPIGPGAVTIAGSGSSFATARWGTDIGFGQSGYNFGAAGTTAISVPPSPSANFSLGIFAHVNQPIRDTSITAIVLTVAADIAVDGASVGARQFVFDFAHSETPNGSDPCLFGGANNQGVNVNGCADAAKVAFNSLSQSFSIGGVDYSLGLRGFLQGGTQVTQFLSPEEQINTANLVAFVATRQQLTGVPVPAAIGLFAAGLFGLAALRRRA